ncbi:MAG: phospholipase [Rheinheimera sp.]|uniref:patatin-like phospholipase family protein n=1 Tax=Arsukibacterium sp. UBA3155 TaxID=1946058 RepID=UPI000C8FF907|nr:patatin-like phospholipase family protein [Arsukibacterium sp. UBA3155]MAD74828.1 phospholipase [Rheinheimera sp.]|tara:strand:- start:62365 stop:63192 length:828 start_codon:yes stop_codon:yes gene_type:complete
MPKEIVPILSGGGTRLSCYIGILEALQQQGLTFRHIVGVSGGSIVAALFAAGWNLQQMHELALKTDFKQFRGLSITKLVRLGGLSDGNAFETWLDKILEGRRFVDLQLDLHVLATDIQGGGPVIFNRQLTPDVKVSQAIRFSMSIPLFFSFKRFKHHVMTDGVILSEDALHRDWSGQGLPVVCFRLKSEASYKPIATSRYFPVLSYIYMLIQTFMNAISREYVHAEYWHNTIVVNTGVISSVNFDMTLQQKQWLYDIGYQTANDIVPVKLAELFT